MFIVARVAATRLWASHPATGFVQSVVGKMTAVMEEVLMRVDSPQRGRIPQNTSQASAHACGASFTREADKTTAAKQILPAVDRLMQNIETGHDQKR